MGLLFCFSSTSDMPKKTEAAKAEPKGKKPVPKKTVEKAPVVEEKKAPSKSITKAQKVQKRIVKGTHGTRVKKVRTSVHFRRPKPSDRPGIPSTQGSPLLLVIVWMPTILSSI